MNKLKADNSKAVSILILAVLSVIWGSSFILIKKGLDSFEPGQVGTIRIIFACLVLLPIALKYLKIEFIKNWKKILSLGLIANLIPAVLYAVAETKIRSSLAGMLNSLTPIFTVLAGTLLFRTTIKSAQFIGIIVGFAGTITLGFIGSDGGFGAFNYFALFIIIATICYGISSNMVKTYFSRLNSVILTALTMFSIGPIAVIYLFSTDFIGRMSTVDGAWLSLGYLFLLGAVGTAFALILFNKLIQATSAVFASTVTYLIPITAVIWGILDGEELFVLHYIGMLLIILGVFIINRFR